MSSSFMPGRESVEVGQGVRKSWDWGLTRIPDEHVNDQGILDGVEASDYQSRQLLQAAGDLRNKPLVRHYGGLEGKYR